MDNDFVLPKYSKRRKNNRKDFIALSFSQKLVREAAIMSGDGGGEWLLNTRGKSYHRQSVA